MSKKFEGKIAVVTGGSAGMGLATAKRFVKEGIDHVFITGRGKDALDAAAAEIGKNVTAVQGDVAKLSDLDRLYDAVKKTQSTDRHHFCECWPREAGPVWDGGREVFRPSLRRKRERTLLFRTKGSSANEGRRLRHP
jgi:NAD(P)-dependent dehydrogenase (short-subunit alcohol dehydrogenase family)